MSTAKQVTDKMIGIDLGTTNSVLGVIQAGQPVLLPIQGSLLLPSVVGISPQNEVVVGTPARNQWVVAPDRTVRSIKRKMGKGETVNMAGKDYTPQELSAFILRTIKAAAEAALGQPVTRAVITVPAYFNEVQRQATLEAGAIAGLTVERIINEPTAAALAYGYGIDPDQHLRVLVYDLGGGTFDVSIIELNAGVVDVLSTAGDNLLGGDDFDERLAAHLAEEFQSEHEVDLSENHQAWARLLRTAEETKIALSAAPFATVNLEYIAQSKKKNALHIQREVTREEFVGLIQDLLDRTVTLLDQAMADAKLQPQQIDRVLLVGGSTRIPAVWEMVTARMGQEPHVEIDPDAAVALGAAVQAGMLAGEEIDAILVDVTPLSLGIETADITFTGMLDTDRFVPLIRRNATVPVQKSEIFTTMHPAQTTIQIKVYQGESPVASQNVLLGDFKVEGLKADLNGGLAKVLVNFQLDVNGILEVTVTERATGKQVKERLKADRQRLSPEQIAESQAKLSALYEQESEEEDASPVLEFDAGTLALLDRARQALENPKLDPAVAADLHAVIDQITDAAEAGDEDALQDACDELIDLLIAAEE